MNSLSLFPRRLIRTAAVVCIQFALAMSIVTVATHSVMAVGTSNGITGPVDTDFRPGMWWDRDLSGSGWEINRSGDTAFGIWYTYDADGRPTWYTTAGPLLDGRFEHDLLSFSWDYENNRVNKPTVAGKVTIDFLHPQLAELTWQLGEHQDQHTIRPFIFATAPTLSDYSGSFYDPGESGYGISVQTQADLTYVVMYYYDAKGKPIWSAGVGRDGSRTLPMLDFRGACPWCEYAKPSHSPSGEVVLNFLSESTMSVDMIFSRADPFWTKLHSQHRMISNLPSGRPHPAALATIASKEALALYYKAGFLAGNGSHDNSWFCPPPIVSPAPPVTPPPSAEAISATNVQVQGVDEADVIKATTEFIYSLDYPLGEIPYSDETSTHQQSVTRYRISASGEIPYGDGSFPISLPSVLKASERAYLQSQGLYHYSAEATESQKLVYLASQHEGGCQQPSAITTFIHSFDTGMDTDFTTVNRLQIDGELIASRTIGEHLFIAVTHKPNLFTLATEVLGVEAARQMTSGQDDIKALFNAIDPELLFPSITYSDGSQRQLVAPENIMMPPLPLSFIEPVLSTLIRFDLNDLEAEPASVAIMGRIDGMYANHNSVYFASSRNEYVLDQNGSITRSGFRNTDIHKLAITENTLEYRGSGSVEGYLGHDRERLAFRMSEYQDQLRVVSSSSRWRERWGDLGRHRLTILGEAGSDDLLLDTISVLPNASRPENIGKPGEDIHAVRFQGKKAYVVTFEQIDPLYMLDLSDAEDPRVLGELEIDGFSDYLHPIGDDLLVGIGMQAIPSNSGFGGFWLQGVQVGLFDVSAPTTPVLLDLEKIGYRGTSTSVLDTHRAFTYLPADQTNGKPMRFIIPLIEHSPVDGIVNPDPSYRYPWSSTGIRMFEVNLKEGGLSTLGLVGSANVANRDTAEQDVVHFYQYGNEDYSRSVIYADHVFHYFRGGLFTTEWSGIDLAPADNCPLCKPGE